MPGVTAPYESLNEVPNDNSIVTLAASGGSEAYESIQILDNEDHYDVAETVEEQGWTGSANSCSSTVNRFPYVS